MSILGHMIPVYSVAQVRTVESAEIARQGSLELMKQAAQAISEAATAMLEERSAATVVGLVGPGNNGGDGLFALANLARQGHTTTAVLFAASAHEESLAEYRKAGGSITTLADAPHALEGADLLIDALYGIGYRSGAELPPVPLRARVLAVDVPSGLDAESGTGDDAAIRADRTVTFGAMKSGLVSKDGPLLTGDIEVVALGFDFSAQTPQNWLVDPASARALLDSHRSWRDAGRHKYQRGVLGLIAGSAKYPGAAQLSARAAIDAGVGMLRIHVPAEIHDYLATRAPEAVPMSEDEVAEALSKARRHLHGRGAKISAWAIGPGIDSSSQPSEVISKVFTSRQPAVIDASGLEIVPTGASEQPRVLTPHAKELRMLLSRAGITLTAQDIADEPVKWTRWAALAYNAVVLLKGPTTYIVEPGGQTLLVSHSSPKLATAGSGDVLTGILGTLLSDASLTGATGTTPVSNQRLLELCACAAVIHGEVGRVAAAQGTVSASRLLEHLPAVLVRFGF